MDSGVAGKPIVDMGAYRTELRSRLDPTVASLHAIFEEVRSQSRRVVFAEGEEEKSIRAAIAFRNAGYGTPILIGREDRVRQTMDAMGLSAEGREYRDPLNARAQRPPTGTTPTSSMRSIQRQGAAVPGLPAYGQPGPQRLRRLHGGHGRCRCHGHGV